jgi:hypothetical protein
MSLLNHTRGLAEHSLVDVLEHGSGFHNLVDKDAPFGGGIV